MNSGVSPELLLDNGPVNTIAAKTRATHEIINRLCASAKWFILRTGSVYVKETTRKDHLTVLDDHAMHD